MALSIKDLETVTRKYFLDFDKQFDKGYVFNTTTMTWCKEESRPGPTLAAESLRIHAEDNKNWNRAMDILYGV